MHAHTLTVLGLEVSFKAEADPNRIARACSLLEEKYAKLVQAGGHLSREKLLIFLSLALADDVLLAQSASKELDERILKLLGKLDNAL